jgi:hypothetical protein
LFGSFVVHCLSFWFFCGHYIVGLFSSIYASDYPVGIFKRNEGLGGYVANH